MHNMFNIEIAKLWSITPESSAMASVNENSYAVITLSYKEKALHSVKTALC